MGKDFTTTSQTDVGKQDNLFGAEDSGINGTVVSQNDLADRKQKNPNIQILKYKICITYTLKILESYMDLSKQIAI